MPAPARISVPVKQPTPVKSSPSPASDSPSSIPRTKARVVHRRRARGRLGDTESDDELVREPHSDSDSESVASTLDSESISESEVDQHEEEAIAEARVPSPPQTAPIVAASASSPPSQPSPRPLLFQSSHDWSEMVSDENANGAAALPVIDFADISSHVETSSLPSHPVLSPSPSVHDLPRTPRGAAGTPSSSTVTRKPAQSARQAYLTRLDSDPAYVPTLGQFWSHDDRLLDKELRSLSGWWRGRWQGRGRGMRGRGGLGTQGRGGFGGLRGSRSRGAFGNGGPSRPGDLLEEETHPADRSWTHDGFEELKQDDDANRQPFPYRGRGAFPRGRGGHRGSFPSRGGTFASSNPSSSPREPQTHPQPEFQEHSQPEPQSHLQQPELQTYPPPAPQARTRPKPQQSSTSDILRFGNGTRPWFSMKPERVWTKQFDGYLYFEADLKPVHNQGIGQGVRIKLPRLKSVAPNGEGLNNDAVVVRVPLWNPINSWTVPSMSKEPLVDRAIVVRLPPSKTIVNEHEDSSPEDVITVAPPPMDDPLPSFPSVPAPPYRTHPEPEDRPNTLSRPLVHSPWHTADIVHASGSTSTPLDLPAEVPIPQEAIRKEPYMVNDVASASSSQSRMAVHPHGHENSGTASPRDPRSSMPPVLQAMAPPFQPSPAYGSPYAYAISGSPLPPGIAVSEEGVTYEIATGRTVYLHTPPPPPPPPMQLPMYNPRPMPMHPTHHGSVHFLPHHTHGHASSMSMSVSPPAFLASPPIFALPRQSSRVEIRAPGEEKGKDKEVGGDGTSQGRQAGSRLAVNVNAEPFTPASHMQPQAMGYYAAEQQAFDNAQHQQQQSIYQPPPFYYPVNADGSTSYGYGQPYAGVDAGQPQQYESYGQESYHQQHAVYY
jgi:CASC3/Barentsz eIF4AIII binding